MTNRPDEQPPMKRRKKRALSEADLGLFVQKYGRRAHRGHDPNDRSYDRDIENKIKRMKPTDIDRLMHGENDEPKQGSNAEVSIDEPIDEALQ